MAEQKAHSSRPTLRTYILFLIPVILLAGVIALFLSTGGGLRLEAAAPVEGLAVERYTLKHNSIDLQIRNTGPQEIVIAQVIINNAVVPFTIGPDASISRLGRANIHVDYPWTSGEAYGITIFTSNSIAFGVDIPVAFDTPQPSGRTFWGFTLIGLYVAIFFFLLFRRKKGSYGP